MDHITSIDLRNLPIDTPHLLSKSKLDRVLQGTSEAVHQSAKLFAYRSLRAQLYPFLKLAFEHWPRDDTLDEVVDIGLAYITPWDSMNEPFSEESW